MDKPRTYWDTFQSSYQMGHQKHRDFLLDMLKREGVTSLLDVGCGTGPIYELIKGNVERWENFIEYKGTDYSPAMIEIAKKSFPNGNWEVEDARHLTEKDNTFDCVLLMHCLDHLDDYESAIKEAARVSKSFVCIVLWRPLSKGGSNNLNSVNRMGKKDGEEPWEDTHLQDYSASNLDLAFRKAGLGLLEFIDDDHINDNGRYNTLFLLKKI